MKPRPTALATQKKPAPLDDYFRRGPFEMARMGKFVVMRNNMTKEQHEAYLKFHAERLPIVIAEIDAHVRGIVAVVEKFHPLTILQRGYWEEVGPLLMREDHEPETKESVIAQRMVDYVQSVIAAVPPISGERPPITDEGWKELLTHVEGVFDVLNREYVYSRTASWRVNGDGLPENRQEFYVRAVLMWCNVTGHRYHHQEVEYLRELLAPHTDVFQRLWGLDTDGLVNGLGRILDSLSRGLGESILQMIAAHEDYQKVADRAEAEANDTLLDEKMADLTTDPSLRAAAGRIMGFDLFKVDGLLPEPLLRELAWAPGECTEFIDGKDYSGWPTRIWPRTLRPFLAVDGSYYCFDVHSLFDHIYRVLQRTVARLEPGYRDAWNKGQKVASEAFPLKLFRKLCPEAKVWSSTFYQNRELDPLGHRKWCELDGLVCGDGHLFIVEVKAGVFTLAPPETGIDIYVRSIEKLVFDPVDQGERFLRWLESEGTVDLFDEQHAKIGELRRSDFEHVTVCAITVDPFTEIAAKSHHLRSLVGHQGKTPFWALSIGDLMTYTELFQNPLVFLHYVEKRGQAIESDKLVLDDEFDHYGMYLKHNNYHLYAEQTMPDGKVSWTGYRTEIDAYFNAGQEGQPVTAPTQELPPLYSAMLGRLAASQHRDRRRVASLLLDYSGHTKKEIALTVERSLREQSAVRRPKPLSIYGDHTGLTFYCWQNGVLVRSATDALRHAKTCMLTTRESERLLIELLFAADGTLLEVEPTFLRAAELTPAERLALEPEAQRLTEERIKKTAFNGKRKLGPNDTCPCGSGKKYKKCCRP